MKELFCSYETSLKLKEKGFNPEIFFGWYTITGRFSFHNAGMEKPMYDEDTKAPLYQQVIDWFRERHNIMIELHWQEGTQNYSFCYGFKAGKWFFPKETFEYYKALNEAIIQGLKLIQ